LTIPILIFNIWTSSIYNASFVELYSRKLAHSHKVIRLRSRLWNKVLPSMKSAHWLKIEIFRMTKSLDRAC